MVYSNSCCCSSFEREIIKIGQSSHKMYSNNLLNFQESTTILNACKKKSGNFLNALCISLEREKTVVIRLVLFSLPTLFILINSQQFPVYHIYQLLRSGRIWHKVNFYAEFNRFEFRVFPSPRLLASPWQKKPNLPYYLPIPGGRIIGFIPFPTVLVLCEMQSVSSRIWTRIVESNSYDDNLYTTGTSSGSFQFMQVDIK